MYNKKITSGKFIKIYQLSDFYNHVTEMLLEHFDNEKHNNYLFAIGTYCIESISVIKNQFPNYKIIAYQLEQLMGGKKSDYWHNVENIINNLKDADEIWDYDYINSEYLLKYYEIKVDKIVNLLYTKSLKKIDLNKNPFFDVLFYGSLNQRRLDVFYKIQSQLYGQIKMCWIYGSCDIDNYIYDSKTILNLHAFEPYNRQEQVRMFYPVINSKTIISETSQLNNMPKCIIESDILNISKVILSVCKTNLWIDFGIQAEENFKKTSEEKIKQYNA